MLRFVPFVLLALSALFVLSCANDPVVRTAQLTVDYDRTFDFMSLRSFSVVTQDVAPPDAPEPDEDQVFFNTFINDLIIDAMTSPPVCLELIDPDEVTEENQPDVWAANGLGRTTEEGVIWQCQGGWWWGWWGWFWDPCAWIVPVPVEADVGNLFVPVGLPQEEGEDANIVFAGLAQSIATSGADWQAKAEAAVEAIFAQWPVNNVSCAQ